VFTSISLVKILQLFALLHIFFVISGTILLREVAPLIIKETWPILSDPFFGLAFRVKCANIEAKRIRISGNSSIVSFVCAYFNGNCNISTALLCTKIADFFEIF